MARFLRKLFRRISSLGVLLPLACNSPAKSAVAPMAQPTQPLDIYLLIGQSNMAGRAEFEPQDAPPTAGAFLLNADDVWEPAQAPLNRYSTIRKDLSMQRLGPGDPFAEVIRRQRPNRSIGLVVNARGGSGIAEWAADTEYYREALRRVHIARRSGQLRAVLWHQGETDSEDTQYVEKLAEFIGRLRRDLALPEVPFIAGQIHNVPEFNQRLTTLPQAVPFTAVVSSEGLVATDQWHFDAPSVKLLGERYAQETLQLTGQ